MSFEKNSSVFFTEKINKSFSKQSYTYDESDQSNKILQDMRHQVYAHVAKYMVTKSRILELNAGTGIDALYYISAGHQVHATDLADGMIRQIKSKILKYDLADRLSCEQLSFNHLDKLNLKSFDYLLSNFGGLNCIQDLSLVTRHLPPLLKPNAYLTWVIMPPVCFWELSLLFRGRWKQAFRRFNKNGTLTHLEGEYFNTYYHSLQNIRTALGPSFRLIETEGLAVLSPQPHHKNIPLKFPFIYRMLRKLDAFVKNSYPFNRCADHLIVTFQYRPV